MAFYLIFREVGERQPLGLAILPGEGSQEEIADAVERMMTPLFEVRFFVGEAVSLVFAEGVYTMIDSVFTDRFIPADELLTLDRHFAELGLVPWEESECLRLPMAVPQGPSN